MRGRGTEARATRRKFAQQLGSVLPAAFCWLAAYGRGSRANTAHAAFTLTDLQAAMIEKIVSFIVWPESVWLERDQRPFLITVLGASPIAGRLQYLFDRQPPWGHKALVSVASDKAELSSSHVLFIAPSFAGEVKDVLKALEGRATLTVGSVAGLCARGVAVNLVGSGNRLSFEINRSALARASLKASYHLLSRARLVDEA